MHSRCEVAMTRLSFCQLAFSLLVPVSVHAQVITAVVSKAQNQTLVTSPTQSQVAGPPSTSEQAGVKRRETSITGRLINDSGQPIPNAALYVRKVGASATGSPSIGTDDDGRFGAVDVAPGAATV